VLLDNSIELVVTEWACLLGGYIWVALNTRASEAEIQAIVDDCEPSAFLLGSRYRAIGSSINLPAACTCIEVGGDTDAWQVAVARANPREPVPVGDEQPVRIRYTSGTSGQPKGAVLPRRCYDASFAAVTGLLAPRQQDVLLQAAPMTHAAGAMLLPHAAVGAVTLLVDRVDARVCAELVARHQATTIFVVPTMLVRLLDVADAKQLLRSLRTIVYGGAPTSLEALIRGIEMLGPVFVQIYGLTESTWPVAALVREQHRRGEGETTDAWRARLRTCGRPTSVGAFRIVDAAGQDAGVGVVGEIWVRGANTMSGYWKPRGSVQSGHGDGWIHTGDLALRDPEGNIAIVDRLHDLIISGGFNIHPREVEDALTSHPAVLEAAVVGKPSAEWGEIVHAFVVLRPEASTTTEALFAHCTKVLSGYKKPRSIELVADLPKTASGKVLRRALRDRL
jgi:acyl-CoA synthetase (AMP-forming)/AMP-acid ligase II